MNDRLIIASTARAEDGAYLAMADIAELTAATGTEYRIIGGHMVTAHAARHNLDLRCARPRTPTAVSRSLEDQSQSFPAGVM